MSGSFVKTWSKTQPSIALSVGETELVAMGFSLTDDKRALVATAESVEAVLMLTSLQKSRSPSSTPISEPAVACFARFPSPFTSTALS